MSWYASTSLLRIAIKGSTASNAAPVYDPTTATREVPENSAAGTDVGDPIPEATDAENDTLTYSMAGTDAASFAFDASTRQITTIANVDYNHEATQNSYSVTVTATDSGGSGGSATVTVTIDVTDVNEQPAKPDPPTVTATAGAAGSLDVSWVKPDLNGGPEITGYNLQYVVPPGTVWNGEGHNGTGTTTSFPNLDPDEEYVVRVRAENGETQSDFSEPSAAVRTNAEPTVDDVAVTSTPVLETDTYGAGERIEVSVTFSEAVNATSDTDFQLNVGGNKLAPLVSGSGTTTLVFGYTVQSDDEDDNGIFISSEEVTLVGDRNGNPQAGEITSVATDVPADLDHSGPGTQSDHKVDGTRSIVSVAVTSTPRLETDTYGAGETIEFTVTFNVAVDAAGDPEFQFALGNSGDVREVMAAYVSGTGTTALVFGYTVVASDEDDNGIFLRDGTNLDDPDGPVRLDAGDTIEFAGTSTDVPLLLVRPGDGSRATRWTARGPRPTSTATRCSSMRRTTRDVPENSAPSTDVGDPIPEASDADSDTLTYFMDGTDEAHFSFNDFRQILTFEDLDHETKNTYSVTVTADDGNGGTDTIAVTINVTDVNEKSATPAKPTLAAVDGSSTTLTASWEKPDLDGGPDITGYALQYRAGTAGSWEDFAHGDTAVTTTITGLTADTEYQAQVRAKNGETDSDWSDASDAVSTNAEEMSDPPVDMSGAPTITAVEVTSTPVLETDTYGAGETIEISVTFSEAVRATSATDFVLNADGAKRAPLLLGNETETLVFGYTVAPGDEDDNGIWIGDETRTLEGDRSGEPQNGAITSAANATAADLDHSEQGTQSGHKVDGTRSIRSVAVTSTPLLPDDTYGEGETIEFTVTFTAAVDAAGTPVFEFLLDGSRQADYESGSGTKALVFGYTVVSTDVDDNGIFLRDEEDYDDPDGPVRLDTGDSITFAGTSTDVPLYWQGRGTQSGHKVNGLLSVDNNHPVFTEGDSTTRTVAESSLPAAGNGIEVGAPVVATDADDDTLTYTLKGDDRNSFRFDTDTGQIWTLPPAAFAYPDYSDGDTYQVEVEARDGRDGDDTIAVTINITDEPTEDGDGPTEDGDEPTEDGDEPTEDDGPPEGDDDDDDDDGPGPGPDSDPDPDPEPDLVVDAASVSDDSPVAGGAFTFSATVRNAGDTDSPVTTLRYYRSTDATISTDDSEEGNDAVGALAASASSRESVELTAPSTPGTYYYGACVDAVSGEADTTNNCSTAVQVDVSEAEPVPALPLLGQLLLALGLAAGGAGLARRRRAPTA